MEATDYTGSTRWEDLTVNRIPPGQPFTWLAKGWRDLRAAGIYSLRYGAAIVVVSGLITWLVWSTDTLFLLPFLVAGFFLVAPPLGIGLYLMSAHLERGEPLAGCSAYQAWKRNQSQVAMVSTGFTILLNFWLVANVALFALLYEGSYPSFDTFFAKVFFSEAGLKFSLASLVVGFVIAWSAFAISVITVPMLIDRKVDGFTAIRFSIKSVLGNLPAMMLWAGLIVVIVGLGLATFYLGLILALPLIGHASWHAYRDLVPASQ
ncbi:MAG: DUF2189 domain-containing protein [Pseudomonadota bacterium]